MSKAGSIRGRPLVALVVVLGGWVVARAALWDASAVSVPMGSSATVAGIERAASLQSGGYADQPASVRPEQPRSISRDVTLAAPGFAQDPGWRPPRPRLELELPAAPLASFDVRPSRAVERHSLLAPIGGPISFADGSNTGSHSQGAPQVRRVSVRMAAGHQLLWMAALADMPFPMDALARAMTNSAAKPFFPASREPPLQRRWSTDGWLLLRRGGDAPLAAGATPANYGASQLGAVLRYRLSAESARRPAAYLRATSALNGTGEREAAIGLSARPIASFPLVGAVELRASDRRDGVGLRPAVLAYTELPPFALPLGVRGEFYAQAGYVGGKSKTAFADGQIRLDKRIARFGRAELRAGAGGWAGAQEGASRVDAGPAAVVGLPLSNSAAARLGIDWRFRVAGNARPRSGPAMTLSAGF